MISKPMFPVKVHFLEDGEEWIHENEKELELNLEWFDSEDNEENAIVTDSLNRRVRLKIEKFKIISFELANI